MAVGRSRQDFLEFLEYLGAKGLMAKNTIGSRRAAAGKVLSILSDEEAHDVTKLNLDDIMRRFHNLEGKSYTPGSLMTYQSRLRSALDDFKTYLDQPINFRPNVQVRERKRAEEKRGAPELGVQESEARETASPAAANALSIPLRPDATILIQGLPYDLSEGEAAKIANVIKAMAMPTNTLSHS